MNKTINLNGHSFTVIGILTAKGSIGPQDQDDRILAPATAVQDTLSGYQNLSFISVKATSADTVASAQTQVERILDARHGTTAATRDFTISSSAAILSATSSITTIFTLLLGAIAAISLVVGGIGVMNIMLVTVTERTHEIGIRKAIGAGNGDIVAQFLIEAIMLSMFGGIARHPPRVAIQSGLVPDLPSGRHTVFDPAGVLLRARGRRLLWPVSSKAGSIAETDRRTSVRVR